MDHGSLFDLLHNDTMIIEGELLLPILRDVSQGMRFLHSADPQVIHGYVTSWKMRVKQTTFLPYTDSFAMHCAEI